MQAERVTTEAEEPEGGSASAEGLQCQIAEQEAMLKAAEGRRARQLVRKAYLELCLLHEAGLCYRVSHALLLRSSLRSVARYPMHAMSAGEHAAPVSGQVAVQRSLR